MTKVEVRPDNNASSKPCVPPAVNQFPPALLDQTTRARGGLVLHILLAAYMFIGLAIVCEDFFVPSLTRVSDGESLTVSLWSSRGPARFSIRADQ